MGKRKTTDTLPETHSLRIYSATIEGFLGIKFATLDAQGRHIAIQGKNGSGKTTVVSAVWCAIQGLSKQQYPEPIHSGEEQARITLDLGEFVIVRTITADGMTLDVTMADGAKVKTKPQAFLDSLIPRLGFDLGKFLSMSPREQVKAFLEFCEVQIPVSQVQEITGTMHPSVADESAVEYLERLAKDETGFYYQERRRYHVNATAKEHALGEAQGHLDQLGGPIGDGDKEVSLAEYVGRQQALNALAEQRRQALAAAEDAKREHADHETLLGDLTGQAEAKRQEIDALLAKLHQAKDERKHLLERVTLGNAVCLELARAASQAIAAAQAVADPAPQLAALQTEIAGAEQRNAGLAKRRHALETVQRLGADHQQAVAEHKAADKLLEALRELWGHLLDGVKVIEGLEVGAGELRLKGRPFRQASTAEKIIAGFSIYRRQPNPPPFVLLDGAEALDAESYQLVLSEADKEPRCQVLSTRVADGPLKIACTEAA